MQRRKSAEDRKSEIVGVVLRLADEIGPDRLTTNDVARAVGVSQAAVFRHFPTKADLWLGVAHEIEHRLRQSWEAARTECGDEPLDGVRALVNAQLRNIETCPALPSILFSRELNVDNSRLRAVFRSLLATYQSELVAQFKASRAQGQIGMSLAPEDLAVFLTSLVQGVAIRWSLSERKFPLVAEGQRLAEVQIGLLTERKSLDE